MGSDYTAERSMGWIHREGDHGRFPLRHRNSINAYDSGSIAQAGQTVNSVTKETRYLADTGFLSSRVSELMSPAYGVIVQLPFHLPLALALCLSLHLSPSFLSPV
jgi:hypothetical protein